MIGHEEFGRLRLSEFVPKKHIAHLAIVAFVLGALPMALLA